MEEKASSSMSQEGQNFKIQIIKIQKFCTEALGYYKMLKEIYQSATLAVVQS